VTTHIDALRRAFRATRSRHPFTPDTIVVLPDHLQAIWTLPEGDADFAMRWGQIKSAFSRGLASGERTSRSRATDSAIGHRHPHRTLNSAGKLRWEVTGNTRHVARAVTPHRHRAGRHDRRRICG